MILRGASSGGGWPKLTEVGTAGQAVVDVALCLHTWVSMASFLKKVVYAGHKAEMNSPSIHSTLPFPHDALELV